MIVCKICQHFNMKKCVICYLSNLYFKELVRNNYHNFERLFLRINTNTELISGCPAIAMLKLVVAKKHSKLKSCFKILWILGILDPQY